MGAGGYLAAVFPDADAVSSLFGRWVILTTILIQKVSKLYQPVKELK